MRLAGTMTIAEALALVQADAEAQGYQLQGPNYAVKGDDTRNLYQEAEALAKKATGAPATPIVTVATAEKSASEVGQTIVEEVKKAAGLPSIKYSYLVEKKVPVFVWVAGGIGAALILYLILKPKKPAYAFNRRRRK